MRRHAAFLLLPALLLLGCTSGPRLRMGEVVLRPGDRLEVQGRLLAVELENEGPGALHLTAMGPDARLLRPPWQLGTGLSLIERPDLALVRADNLSEETTQVALDARGSQVRVSLIVGGARSPTP